jgi:formate dehydrogenase subunit delta
MQVDRLIYKANQIGALFASQCDVGPETRIADHLCGFRGPSMPCAVISHIEGGDAALRSGVLKAVRLLASAQCT